MTNSTEYSRAYYLAHRESMLERAKKWSRDHRDRINANKRYRYRTDAEYRARDLERHKAERMTNA